MTHINIFEKFWRHAMTIVFTVSAVSVSPVAEGQRFTQKAGTSIRDVFKLSDIYQFPVFMPSVVQFKNGSVGRSKMNYNRFSGEIEFLQGKDTLELVEKENVKHITQNDSVFYYDIAYGYLLELKRSKTVKLLKREYIRFLDVQNDVGYGGKSSAAAVTNYSSLFSNSNSVGSFIGSRALQLTASQDIIYKRGTDYFFGNEKGKFVRADKKGVLNLFPDKKVALSKYLKENDVDFEDQSDLIQLFTYLSEGE